MTDIVIANGRVIDPSQEMDRPATIRIVDGRIESCDWKGDAHDPRAVGDALVIDASDRIVSPGLIDTHAQLREPGFEEDETIITGTASAVAGGFTTICCLPDTDPPIDSQASVQFVQQKARQANQCNVKVIACVSKNREGQELSEIGSLVEAGAIGFSDAQRPIHNTELLRRALEYCLMFDTPVINHPEVLELSHGGIMHEGRVSLLLGLAGMPADAEDVMAGRDLRLAESTGGRLHLLNISSGMSVELIRRAKARGVRVTAAICPPHFTLTDESLLKFDSNCKLNPPLRSQEDVEACIEGLKDGTLDIIASGHSPRAMEKKMLELNLAPFGAVGFETALPLVITQLIETGQLSWLQALAKLTINPARALDLDRGTLRPGSVADVTIIDPKVKWTVDARSLRSKSHNSPFSGTQLTGQADKVIVDGKIKFDRTA